MHTGTGPGLSPRTQGAKSGFETVTLSAAEMPSHTHTGTVLASTGEGDRTDPTGAYPARPEEPVQPYGGVSDGSMAAGGVQIGSAGSGQPSTNMPPFLVLRFVIALAGLYPSRN